MSRALTTAVAAAAVAATSGWITTGRRLRHCRHELTRSTTRLQESLTDPVTGLLTRAGWDNAAPAHVAQANAAILLDFDRFKHVNDQFGHLAGDAVLRVLAQRLRKAFDPDGLLARFGGDEFVYLGALDHRGIGERMEHLFRKVTAPITVPEVPTELRLSVSIGLAWLSDMPIWDTPGPQQNWREALLREACHAADISMYQAKENGGGWRIHDPQQDPRRPAATILPSPRRVRDYGLAALAEPSQVTSANRATAIPQRGGLR
ncbi:GGDEF domain-containing protein [Amycolatopsis sp. NPDC058986]|uniref:GGDEF domain-containing protein n=1 Tax=unclassified Amycolatopsis TaxID=2618356 RepID=UPI00366E7A93